MFQFSRFSNPLLRLGKIKICNSDQLITISQKYTSWMAADRQDQYLNIYSHSRLIQNPVSGFCSQQKPPNQTSEDDKQDQLLKQNTETTQQYNDVQDTKQEIAQETPEEEEVVSETEKLMDKFFNVFLYGNLSFLIFGYFVNSEEGAFALMFCMFFLNLFTVPPLFFYWGYRFIAGSFKMFK